MYSKQVKLMCTQNSLLSLQIKSKQSGVVLFFSLIALVVMSLAAAALIRSVDTTSLIAGNLSFRRSATLSADSGTESALAWIDSKLAINNTSLNNVIAGETFYYPTNASNAKTLVDGATARLATGVDITAGVDRSGNRITYIIQRMCTNTGVPTEQTCLLNTNSNAQKTFEGGVVMPIITVSKTPMYRVTTRVVGPKNTVSYIQVFIS